MTSLKNQRIVILGGSAGIGFAVAEQAAHDGAHVVIASSSAARVAAAVAKLPRGEPAPSASTAHAGHTVDLRSPSSIQALFATLGAFDHLVYTAGDELLMAPLASLDFAAARAAFEIRYWGALAAVQAAAPHLARTGSIVLTSGTAGRRPHPGFVIGSSVCGAMEAVTRTLAVELAPVRVNIVVPGFVDTELWSNVPAPAREQMFRDAAAKLPVKHIAPPAEIAEHYLSFMRGAYVTGQSIVVDGGSVLV